MPRKDLPSTNGAAHALITAKMHLHVLSGSFGKERSVVVVPRDKKDFPAAFLKLRSFDRLSYHPY